MIYNYYMKINFTLLFAVSALLFCAPLHAQVTVVKQQGSSVYLDISDFNRRVSVGDTFKVILSQETLTNPTTGKELGLINHYSPAGKITEVQPLYAIGQAADDTVYSIGQEVIIESVSGATNAELSAPQDTLSSSSRKIKTYDVLEREIISAVQIPLTDSSEEIAALDANGNLILYAIEGNALKEITQFVLPNRSKPLSLSAKDLLQSGLPQLFVTIYKEDQQKIVTLVFELQENQFKQIASIPYFVKEIGCGDEKSIYAQVPFISNLRAGNAHKLIYQNGRFKLEKESFRTRGNWLAGSQYAPVQNKDTENFIYTASNGRLRLRLNNGKFADSPALFATAPNRVKYKQEIVSFYPALQVYNQQGHAVFAGIENTAKFGLLSEQFGQYSGGKIHFLTYENGVFGKQETLELNGFVYDTSCTQHGILVPQVLPSGQTVLAEIYR